MPLTPIKSLPRPLTLLACVIGLACAASSVRAAAAAPAGPSDRDRMLTLLGLPVPPPRAGPENTTNESIATPPNSKYPDPLVLNNGQPVRDAATWRNQRRPEIFEEFARDIYGRVPAGTPKVAWAVTNTSDDGTVKTKTIVGTIDNSGYPALSPTIQITLRTPSNAGGPVPVIVYAGAGGGGGAPRAGAPAARGARGAAAAPAAQANLLTIANLRTVLTLTDAQAAQISPLLDAVNQGQAGVTAAQTRSTDARTTALAAINVLLTDTQKTQFANVTNPAPAAGARGGAGGGGPSLEALTLAKGWGYATFNTGSVQPDSAAGLTQGIIGLMNKGQMRAKPDEWGVLLAWSWGLSKSIDYFETDRDVDAKQLAVDGFSRWGKTAVLAAALDERWALAWAGDSGEGGTKMHRRNFGETVDQVAQNFPWWMAGNFQKFFGPENWEKMTVDSHELVALVAPRPVFITGGTQDQHTDGKGMFLAAALASPVYELLGKKGLGTMEMPAPDVALISGEIGFRFHTGGHTPAPDLETFLAFCAKYFKAPTARK